MIWGKYWEQKSDDSGQLYGPGSLCRSCSKLDISIAKVGKDRYNSNYCSYNHHKYKMIECQFYEREPGSDDE